MMILGLRIALGKYWTQANDKSSSRSNALNRVCVMGLFNWLLGRSSSRTKSQFFKPRTLRTGRFGEDRHKPDGNWVQTTLVETVVGIQHRQSEVLAFCGAVQGAELSNTPYGVQVRPEPSNSHDQNAIAVDGFVGKQRWHVGYLGRDTAKEINRDLVSKKIPIAAELYNLWIGDDGYIDIKIIILAPSGYGTKARIRHSERP